MWRFLGVSLLLFIAKICVTASVAPKLGNIFQSYSEVIGTSVHIVFRVK